MRQLRVLLVDDHDGFLNAAQRQMRNVPWVVVVGRALNGLEAVRLTDELTPDAVLMDLAMPEMGGLQATRLIKAQTNPPFVVITSHFDDPQHREHAASAGADAFVSKMFYVQEVMPILERLANVPSGSKPNV